MRAMLRIEFSRYCWIALAMALWALPPARAAAGRGEEEVYPLRYQTAVGNLRLENQSDEVEVTFQREPADTQGHKVFRDALLLDHSITNFIGLLLDEETGKLYLDHNRNLDLTDEGTGVYDTDDPGSFEYADVVVTLTHGGLAIPYHLEIDLWTYGGHLSGRAFVKSGWQGLIHLGGQAWRATVVDNLDGVIGDGDEITLEPEEEHAENAGWSRIELPGFTNLHMNGRRYHCTYGLDEAAEVLEGPRLIMRTLEDHAGLPGQVHLQGAHVLRLEFQEGPVVAVLENPGEFFSLPVGEYPNGKIIVGIPAEQKVYKARLKPLLVEAAQPAVLKAGGPLRPHIEARRQGRTLSMDYRLLGQANERYASVLPLAEDQDQRPGFEIHRNGAVLESGHFEYG